MCFLTGYIFSTAFNLLSFLIIMNSFVYFQRSVNLPPNAASLNIIYRIFKFTVYARIIIINDHKSAAIKLRILLFSC